LKRAVIHWNQTSNYWSMTAWRKISKLTSIKFMISTTYSFHYLVIYEIVSAWNNSMFMAIPQRISETSTNNMQLFYNRRHLEKGPSFSQFNILHIIHHPDLFSKRFHSEGGSVSILNGPVTESISFERNPKIRPIFALSWRREQKVFET
jgi:hypothetical protein